MNNTIIGVDKSGSYRVYLSVTTEMVEKARKIHNCTPLASAALGRVITGAAMMGLMLKSESDKLTVQFKGDGPAKEVLATAYASGEVKGYIADPYVDLPLKENGKLDVGGAIKGIGEGSLTVIKDLGMKEPYVGRIELVSGEIAEDLTQYYLSSEQQPSSVALGVRMSENGTVSAAGGMFIQVLPQADEECLTKLEDMLFFMDSFTLLVQDAGGDVYKLKNLIFGKMPEEYGLEVLEERNVSWSCDCSRERMEKALISVGRKELSQIINEDHGAELTCQFCRNKYNFSEEELLSLLKEAR